MQVEFFPLIWLEYQPQIDERWWVINYGGWRLLLKSDNLLFSNKMLLHSFNLW